MSAHVFIRELDTEYAEKYPNEPPEFLNHVECPVGCNGWQECTEDVHKVPGYDGVNDGPYESDEDAPWCDEEEYEFHGVLHTWNGNGYGWTIPFNGCVVSANDYSDPYDIPERAGKWLVDDDWDDSTVSLTGIVEMESDKVRGTLVRPVPERGFNEFTPRFIATYVTSQGVESGYAQAFSREFWREGRETAVTLSVPSVMLAFQRGVPAEYAHAADTYTALFAIGDERASTVVSLFEAGVSLDYIRAGMNYRITPSALIAASKDNVPQEYLAAVSGD
jgi:hypothetical protein